MEFDHIVVGAGSAGCVLARRLAENGAATVLLLEAGGSDAWPSLRVPIGYGRSFYNRRVNWMYRTEPEAALDGRQGYWPRGRVLGGSSTINAMVYMRGLRRDFDDWRDAGNPGWGWDDVREYFRQIETYHGAGAHAGERGADGPLHVADVASGCHPLCENFLRACEEIGLRRSPDLNGVDPEGVAHYQITTKNGLRMSAARAFLPPGRRPAGLRLELHAHVLRIDIEGRRAVGVAYRQAGRLVTARARRGVVLAAGAIASPLLLQLSGVGDPALLARHGIATVHSLPAVGTQLQDHLCIDYVYRARVPTLNQELGRLPGQMRAALRYALFRTGPLALSVNQAGGLVRSIPEQAAPDMQLYFSPLSYTRAEPGRRTLMRPDPFPAFLLGAQPCRPYSRGRIEIASADPLAAPRIEPGSLSDERDLWALLRGARLLRRIAAAPALAAVVAGEMAPGPAIVEDAAMIEDIRARASTVFHPVGTCRMGRTAADSVVDARLGVHGLAGLWVADASVFPSVTSANTNAPVMMVAEKAAAMIRHDVNKTQ